MWNGGIEDLGIQFTSRKRRAEVGGWSGIRTIAGQCRSLSPSTFYLSPTQHRDVLRTCKLPARRLGGWACTEHPSLFDIFILNPPGETSGPSGPGSRPNRLSESLSSAGLAYRPSHLTSYISSEVICNDEHSAGHKESSLPRILFGPFYPPCLQRSLSETVGSSRTLFLLWVLRHQLCPRAGLPGSTTGTSGSSTSIWPLSSLNGINLRELLTLPFQVEVCWIPLVEGNTILTDDVASREGNRPPSYGDVKSASPPLGSSYGQRDEFVTQQSVYPIIPPQPQYPSQQQYQTQPQYLSTPQTTAEPRSPSRGIAGRVSSFLKSHSSKSTPNHQPQQGEQYYGTQQGYGSQQEYYQQQQQSRPVYVQSGGPGYMQGPPQRSGMGGIGAGGAAALGVGGGLLGGMLLADALEDHDDYQQGFEDGADFGGDYGDF